MKSCNVLRVYNNVIGRLWSYTRIALNVLADLKLASVMLIKDTLLIVREI